jgi:hypothetical protein
MRAADLVGCLVYDTAGEEVGHVHDLRFEAAGAGAGVAPRYQLTGLACGKWVVGHRLGYGRGDMAGPWPLNRIYGRVDRRSVVVQWGDIVRIDGGRIDIRRRRDELEPIAGKR